MPTYRRCMICKRKATGALVLRGFRCYLGAGHYLCQDHLVEATHANLARRLYVEDLVLAAARTTW